MDITRRCDYACRILRAAYRNGEGYVSVSDIAEEEGIPYAFARSIQHDLVKGGLIKTVRGAHGGLTLNCDPERTTLLEVLEAIQGPVSVAVCVLDPEYCERQGGCAYNKLWRGADALLHEYFASITLKDLIEQGASHPVIEAALARGASVGSSAASGAGSCAAECCSISSACLSEKVPGAEGGRPSC